MSKKIKNKKIVIVFSIFCLLTAFLCGCTEENSISENSGVDLSHFIGTWSGNMETSMFGLGGNPPDQNFTNPFENNTNGNFSEFRFNNTTTTNITNLEFSTDTVSITIETKDETQVISQPYTVEGDKLILGSQFGDMQQQPFNEDGERPPFDGENPFNGEPPSDGDRPFDGDFPSDGERPNFNGDRNSRKMSYTYSFNEDYSILYLDESPFIKN